MEWAIIVIMVVCLAIIVTTVAEEEIVVAVVVPFDQMLVSKADKRDNHHECNFSNEI